MILIFLTIFIDCSVVISRIVCTTWVTNANNFKFIVSSSRFGTLFTVVVYDNPKDCEQRNIEEKTKSPINIWENPEKAEGEEVAAREAAGVVDAMRSRDDALARENENNWCDGDWDGYYSK